MTTRNVRVKKAGVRVGEADAINFVEAGNVSITAQLDTLNDQINVSLSAGGGVGGNQTGISGIANSETTYTSGTVSLSELGALTIRSTTGNQYQFSVPTGATATGNLGAIANSETTYTSGTVNLSVVGGALTIRSTTGNAFQFSASQSAQTGISAISNSNTTYTSGTIGLSELGAITIRSTTGNQFQFSVNSQTNQTGGIYVTTQSTGQSSSSTYDLRTLSIVPDGIISAGWSGGSFRISGPAQTALTASTVSSVSSANAVGANNSRFAMEAHIHEGVRRMGISTGGNTAGTTGIFPGSNIQLVGLSRITLSQSTDAQSNNTISIVGNETISMYANSNTTQSSTGTANLSSINFAGAGVASVGITGGSVVISVPSGGGAGDGGNTIVAGTRTAGTSSSVVFSNSNGISFGLDANPGSVMTASYTPTLKSYFYNHLLQNSQTMTLGNSTSYLMPLDIPYDLSFGFVRLPVSGGATSTSFASTANATGSGSYVWTVNLQVFKMDTGTRSTQLSQVMSTTAGSTAQWSFSQNTTNNHSQSFKFSYPMSTGTSSYSTSVAITNSTIQLSSQSLSQFTGMRHMDFPWATSLSEGPYWLGIGTSSSTATGGSSAGVTGLKLSHSLAVNSQFNSSIVEMGQVSNSSYMTPMGLGSFSIAAGATTASLALSRLSSSASLVMPVVQFINIA